VLEAEGVARAEPGVVLLPRALVDQRGDAVAGSDAERVAAPRADTAGALDLRAVDDLLAGFALEPEPLGDDRPRPALPGPRVVLAPPEPRHRWLSSRPSMRGSAHHRDHPRASRSGALSAAMKSPTSARSAGDPAWRSTTSTMAEPTMTPSAARPTRAPWARVPMPKPTQTGLVVIPRRARRCWVSEGGRSRRGRGG